MYDVYYRNRRIASLEFGETEFKFFNSRPTPYEISDEHGMPFYGVSFTDPFWFKNPSDRVMWDAVNPFGGNQIPRCSDYIFMDDQVLRVVPRLDGASKFDLIPMPFSEYSEYYSLENYLTLPFRDKQQLPFLTSLLSDGHKNIYVQVDCVTHAVLQLITMEV